MYAWQILPIPTKNDIGYAWQWKREDQKGRTDRISEHAYAYYYDCVLDAKKHGYNPEAPRRLR
jgi:hypothetical protein